MRLLLKCHQVEARVSERLVYAGEVSSPGLVEGQYKETQKSMETIVNSIKKDLASLPVDEAIAMAKKNIYKMRDSADRYYDSEKANMNNAITAKTIDRGDVKDLSLALDKFNADISKLTGKMIGEIDKNTEAYKETRAAVEKFTEYKAKRPAAIERRKALSEKLHAQLYVGIPADLSPADKPAYFANIARNIDSGVKTAADATQSVAETKTNMADLKALVGKVPDTLAGDLQAEIDDFPGIISATEQESKIFSAQYHDAIMLLKQSMPAIVDREVAAVDKYRAESAKLQGQAKNPGSGVKDADLNAAFTDYKAQEAFVKTDLTPFAQKVVDAKPIAGPGAIGA